MKDRWSRLNVTPTQPLPPQHMGQRREGPCNTDAAAGPNAPAEGRRRRAITTPSTADKNIRTLISSSISGKSRTFPEQINHSTLASESTKNVSSLELTEVNTLRRLMRGMERAPRTGGGVQEPWVEATLPSHRSGLEVRWGRSRHRCGEEVSHTVTQPSHKRGDPGETPGLTLLGRKLGLDHPSWVS